RHRESREHLPPAAAVHAPRHLVPEALLGLAGDGDAALPRVLAEALDVPGDQAGPLRLGRLRRGRRLGQAADHADLVAVQHHVGRALEPGFGEPSGEPAAQLLRRFARMHVIKITTLTRTAPAPTAPAPGVPREVRAAQRCRELTSLGLTRTAPRMLRV